MGTSLEEWSRDLDDLHIELSLAVASLQEAEANSRIEQVLRSKEKITALEIEISAQRARPFST